MTVAPEVTVSIVSHRQNSFVNRLLDDLRRVCATPVELTVTENAPDATPISPTAHVGPISVRRNACPRGFGANHNAAFEHCRTAYFCVCNPDIHLVQDPFPRLLDALRDPRAAIAGPLVRDPDGTVEDSARRFPTAATLLRKLVWAARGPDYPIDRGAVDVDWVAGMFQVFRSDAFREVGGFDEAFFLYYEDVDICARLRARGRRVTFEPGAEVVHAAQRASRADPRMARHHFASALRFLARRYR